MVRGMAAAGRVVHEERLVCVLGTYPVEPLDRAVGHRVGEVVRVLLVVELLGRADDLLVLREAGVPLARSAAQDSVEVVEPPAVRPAVERPRRTLLAVGCQVPLAERRRAVAVVPEDPGQGRAVPRQGGGVAREPARELADRPEPHRVVVPPGQQCRPRRGAERRDVETVVAKTAVGHPRVVRGLDRPAEGARVAEPGVVDEHQQHVGGPRRRPRVLDQVPVRLGAGESPVDDSREPLSPDREPAAIGVTHRLRLPRVATAGCPRLAHVHGRKHATTRAATRRALPLIVNRGDARSLIPSGRSAAGIDSWDRDVMSSLRKLR